MVRKCTGLRPGSAGDPVLSATKRALRILARRYKALTVEITDQDTRLRRLCAQTNPALLATHGMGPETAACLLIAADDNPDRMRNDASFAALCAVGPVEASSGRIVRHRPRPRRQPPSQQRTMAHRHGPPEHRRTHQSLRTTA